MTTRHEQSIIELEKAIEDIERKASEEVAPKDKEGKESNQEAPKEKLAPEEETYRKRYSDLRSFAAKKENELKAKLEQVQRQLQEATSKTMKFPKSEDEIKEWAEKYPDVYDTIVTIARKNAIEVNSDVDTRVKEITERERQYARQVAYGELLEAHPDFPQIAPSEEFVAWVEAQPTYIYNALYENETDARAAIRAVDLYKADIKPKSSKKEKDDTREAARAIPHGEVQAAPNNGNEPEFTESKVAKMSWREHERNLEKIEAAMQNPAFYDLSGAAR